MVNRDVITSTVFRPRKTHKKITNVRALSLLGFETDIVEGDKTEGSLWDKHCYSFLRLWNGTQVNY